MYVTNRKKIAKKYLRFFFWIDFVSAFPFHIIFDGMTNDLLKFTTLFKAIRLIRFVRIIKLLSKRSTLTFGLDPIVTRLFKIFFILLFFLHILTCIWYATGNYGDTTNSWIKETCFIDSINSSNCTALADLSFSYHYLVSFYFVLTMSITVGYGDISPSINSTEELAICIVLLIFGTAMYSYFVGAITSTITNLNPDEQAKNENRRLVNGFIDVFYISLLLL